MIVQPVKRWFVGGLSSYLDEPEHELSRDPLGSPMSSWARKKGGTKELKKILELVGLAREFTSSWAEPSSTPEY